jgi:hypothetical protein
VFESVLRRVVSCARQGIGAPSMFALMLAGSCNIFRDDDPLESYQSCPVQISGKVKWSCPEGSAPHIVSGNEWRNI